MQEGKPCVLPLNKSESERYVVTPSIRPRGRQWKAMLKFSLPIFTHCLTWLVFISLDALIYWLIVVLSKRLGELEPLRVPVGIKVQMVQLRVVLSEQFFTDVAEKRAAYLHAKILRKRYKTKVENHEKDLKALAVQPDFWCPLLFRKHRTDSDAV